jgi:hypothetical protein
LQRRGLSTEALDEYLSRSRERVEFLKKAGVVIKQQEHEAPSADHLKKKIREKMGESFLPWLLFSARLDVYYVSPADDPSVTFDVAEEYELLCKSELEKTGSFYSFIRLLGRETLRHKLQMLRDNGSVVAGMEWLRMSHLPEQSDERSFVEMTVRELYPDRGDETGTIQTQSAQTLRSEGFEALVNGRNSDAIVAYRRASELSIAENERPFVQYLTAASWERLFRQGMFPPSKVQAERERQVEELRLASARVDALLVRATPFERSVASTESESLERLARELNAELNALRTDMPDRVIARGWSDDLGQTLDTFRRYRFIPALSLGVAKAHAATAWQSGGEAEKVGAITTLIEYGEDEGLKAQILVEMRAPRSLPIATDLLAELQKETPRFHEERARLGALAVAVVELPASERSKLLARSLESYERLKSQRPILTTFHASPGTPALELALAVLRRLPWTDFKSHIERLKSIAKEGDHDVNWFQWPLAWWSSDADFRQSVPNPLLSLLETAVMAGARRYQKDRVVNLLTDLIIENKIVAPFKEEGAQYLREWLGEKRAPQNDNDDWLRTEAVIALGILVDEEESSLRRVRAAQLRALIEVAIVGGKAPNAYLIRAWLDCFDTLPEEEREIARSIFSIIPPPREHPFGHSDDDMYRRVALILHAHLSQLSKPEAEGACAFVRDLSRSMPRLLPEVADRNLADLAPPFAEAVFEAVADAFQAPVGHREQTDSLQGALACLKGASKRWPLSKIPLSWLFSAARLTTTANPDTAAFACLVLRSCLIAWDNQWDSSRRPVLDEFRRALLLAMRDGRAEVVGAARRAVLDLAKTASEEVRAHVLEHPQMSARLEALEDDARIAVFIAGEDWTRRWTP